MGFLVDEWFMQELRRVLQREIVTKFWSQFQPITNQATDINKEAFTTAVNGLHSGLVPYMRSTAILESLSHLTVHPQKANRLPIRSRVQTLIKAVLFTRVPKYFQEYVREFYSQAFKVNTVAILYYSKNVELLVKVFKICSNDTCS